MKCKHQVNFSLSFEKGIYLCNPKSYQDIDIIPGSPLYLFNINLHTPYPPEATLVLFPHHIRFSVQKPVRNEITQFAFTCVWILSLGAFLRPIYVVVCISISFLLMSIIIFYDCGTVYLFILLFMGP